MSVLPPIDAVRAQAVTGLAARAISAVDTALWDLKAKLLDVSPAHLLGRYRDAVPIYGSGGFTSYDDGRLAEQLAGWVERAGCRWVKIKMGTHPEQDPRRVARAKAAIGNAPLFVVANGACGVTQAIELARRFADEQDVAWFEEPVSSDDLAGLRRVPDRAPSAMEVAAASTATSRPVSGACWRRARSTCCRRTPRDAAVSRGSCWPRRWPRCPTSIFRRIAPRRCIVTSARPRRVFAIASVPRPCPDRAHAVRWRAGAVCRRDYA